MPEYVIAKYIRLSIEDAKTDSMSIENQHLFLDSYIAEMDIHAAVTTFVDNGYSGTNFERPAVQELLELVRAGKVNCIIVKDFSRFGRNAIETGYFIERVFPLYGTRFISVSDNYDSTEHAGDTGGLEVAFKFLIHEQYSRDLSRKIKSAKQEKARRGELISKSCVLGYVKNHDNRLDIDEDAAETVRLIFKLASEGESLSGIERVLYEQKRPTPAEYRKQTRRVTPDTGFDCVWGKSVILKILRDEQYAGTYVAGKSVILDVGSRVQKKKPESEWIRIPNHHPAIISSELFDKVQAIINTKGEPLRNRRLGTSERYAAIHNSPLKGKVICGSCGHTMTLSSTKNAAFHCAFTRSAPDAPCHHLSMPDAGLQAMLLEVIRKRVSNMTDADVIETLHRSEQRYEYELLISKQDEEKRALYESFVRGELVAEEYRTAKTAFDTQLERLHHAYSVLGEEAARVSGLFQSCDELRELTEHAIRENTLSPALVDSLIEKLYIYPDERTAIVWKSSGFGDASGNREFHQAFLS